MAKKKASKAQDSENITDDFSGELIKQLNKEHSSNIAFNLGSGVAPTEIKRWISTGSRQLDCIISNKVKGGFAEGRIVEIQGPTSSGKSHLAYEVVKACQRMGGIAVYMDTENATSLDNLRNIGIDVESRFVFVQTGCTEEVFGVAESTILKARQMNKDVPVVIVWDSVAATAPKAEIEGDYEKQTIGLQARAIGRGMRKITNIIGNQNVLFLLINQQRVNVGVMFGDNTTTPGGMAIPYMSSTRIKITSTGQSLIKDKNGNVIGVSVKAKTIKNKVAHPFRSVSFEIHFGKGIVEHEQVFDAFREHCSKEGDVRYKDKLICVSGTGSWKYFTVADAGTGELEVEEKFYKSDFGNILNNPDYHDYIEALYEDTFVIKGSSLNLENHHTFEGVDEDSNEEVKQVAVDQAELLLD